MSSANSTMIDPLFAENGFTVFRGLWSTEEACSLGDAIVERCAETPDATVSISDVPRRQPFLRHLVFEPRILAAVRSCIGPDIRFAGDFAVQINRLSASWHRDSACRRIGHGGDFNEERHPYAVVKAMIYLKGSNASLAVVPGTHRSPMDDLRFDEVPDAYRWIRKGETVTGPLTTRPDVRPVVVEVEPGDLMLFDLRLAHCARSLDAEGRGWIVSAPGGVGAGWKGEKVVVHLVFGLDNVHTDRFSSYLRHGRTELYSNDVDPAFVADLEKHGLLLSTGLENLFDREPAELEGIHNPAAVATAMSAARSKRAVDWLVTVRDLLSRHDNVAVWGVGTDLNALMGYAPDLVAAAQTGRLAIVDEDEYGRTLHGTLVLAPGAIAASDMPVVLAPYDRDWREHLHRLAADTGIDRARILDVPFDQSLDYHYVNAFDPGWRKTG